MSTPRTAWLRTEGGTAIICAWCDDKQLADERATAAGLKLSHGICEDCVKHKLGVEITPDSFAPVVPFFAPAVREMSGGTEDNQPRENS